jgi:pyruvate dehydrogenase E1 component alpha subunit
MKNLLTKEQLVDFETDIANCFNNAMIKAPVHLYDGNEEQMINIFKNVEPEDWIFTTWRSHYQCLLKVVPQEQVKQYILDGKSITSVG